MCYFNTADLKWIGCIFFIIMNTFSIAVLDGPQPASVSPGWSFQAGSLYFTNRKGLKLFSGKIKCEIHHGFGTFTEGVFHKKHSQLVDRHHHKHEDDKDSILIAFAIEGTRIEISDFLHTRRARSFETVENGKIAVLIFVFKKDEQVSVRFRQGAATRHLIISHDPGYLDADVQVFEAGADKKKESRPSWWRRFLPGFHAA